MSEENKNNVNFDEKEPIESIEKTVNDLRKKIEEISSEEPEEEKTPLEETKSALDDLSKKTVETLSNGFDSVKETASKVVTKENMDQTIDFIKTNAVKAKETAKSKFEELQNDPNVQDFSDKAKDAFHQLLIM